MPCVLPAISPPVSKMTHILQTVAPSFTEIRTEISPDLDNVWATEATTADDCQQTLKLYLGSMDRP